LATVLRDLLHSAKKPAFSLNDDSISAAVGKYVGEAPEDVRRFIQASETIVPQPVAGVAVCVNTKAHTFDLGFEGASFASKRIAGVKPESNAYRAGVRNGQSILAGGFQPGNPDTLVQLKVSDRMTWRTSGFGIK